jgi:aminopeptidase N
MPYHASATKSWELIHTQIDISFNLSDRSAEATASLKLHPYFYPIRQVVLDAKSMKILAVETQDEQALNYDYDGQQLKITLPHVFQRDDTLQLRIQYIALPYAGKTGGGKAITEDRGLYFINTDHFEARQPIQIWTQGETEANSHWFPTFDKPNFRSSFQITMHVPDSFSTLSNGILTSSVKEKDHQRADTWVQDIPIPPYLAMMVAGDYAISKEQWRGKEVNYYVPPLYAPYAKEIFKNTPEMIEFFSDILKVDYPWAKYSQAIGYDYVSGAMENVSASLFGAFNLKDARQIADDNNDFIVAHELFHQWFGDYVTCESWSQITLNESFADFSEKLWAEYKYGKDEAQIERLASMKRYLGQATYSDLPLVRFHYEQPDDVFDRVSYSKGGWVLHYLRMLAGDPAFFQALHLYLTGNALKSTEATQLRLSLEQVTGEDWKWFFDEWYYRGGHPILDISYQYDDADKTVTVVVKQKQTAGTYRLPLKAQIIRGDSLQTVDWLIDGPTELFTYPYSGNTRPVIIPDAGHWLPGEIADHKEVAEWQKQFRSSTLGNPSRHAVLRASFLDSVDLMSRYDALIALARNKDKKIAVAVLKEAMQDKSFFIRRTALDLLSDLDLRNDADWKPILIELASGDADNKVRAAAIAYLGNLDAKEYATTFEIATEDKSYIVATAALIALNKTDHNRARVKAEELLDTNRFSDLWETAAGMVFAVDNKPEDYGFYQDRVKNFYEGARSRFLVSFAEYLSRIKEEDIFENGLILINTLAVKEGPGSRFQFPMFSNVYSLYQNAEKEMKIAGEKDRAAMWKLRRDKALQLWNAYKRSVSNKDILKQIAALEKGL